MGPRISLPSIRNSLNHEERMIPLTDEQKALVLHPQGHHAKVLAVVGSGRTSALVYRIKHLVVKNYRDIVD